MAEEPEISIDVVDMAEMAVVILVDQEGRVKFRSRLDTNGNLAVLGAVAERILEKAREKGETLWDDKGWK